MEQARRMESKWINLFYWTVLMIKMIFKLIGNNEWLLIRLQVSKAQDYKFRKSITSKKKKDDGMKFN